MCADVLLQVLFGVGKYPYSCLFWILEDGLDERCIGHREMEISINSRSLSDFAIIRELFTIRAFKCDMYLFVSPLIQKYIVE